MTVLCNFPVRSTCNIIEVEDPGGSEQTDSTDAEPEEESRLPRSPRRLHPASRRSPVLRSEHVFAVAATSLTQPVSSVWIQLACCSSFLLYRLSAILALVSIHDTERCWRCSAWHQHLSIHQPTNSASASTRFSSGRHAQTVHPVLKYESFQTVIASFLH